MNPATRRQFLVRGLGVTAALPLASWMPVTRAAWSRRGRRADAARVLVVLQLTGGNDGLNTVVPLRQDAYYKLRPTLGLERGSLHALRDERGGMDHGLHPSLKGLAELYAEGSVGVIQGIGYPNPDRSHFRSMDIWHTGLPSARSEAERVGWLGRLADQMRAHDAESMPAIHVGDGDLPLALYGRVGFAPSFGDASAFQLRGDPNFARWRTELLRPERVERQSEARFLRDAAATTYAAVERMRAAAERPSAARYPDHGLARRLELIARLVSGGFETRLFHVALEGFDTHARQSTTHAALLQELSQSVTAFQRDLESSGHAERVVTLIFSEFGRRAAENGSRGTDHGAGAPAFLVGRAVKGGLHGTAPNLEALENGDVPYAVDFRTIYTNLETDWMGCRSSTTHPSANLIG